MLCGPYLRILITSCKQRYPVFKQEAAKKVEVCSVAAEEGG